MEPMQQPDVFTTCPTCHARINVTAALHTFLTTIADETLPEQFYLSLQCDHCNMDTVALFLQPEEILDARTKRTLLDQLLKAVQQPPQAE